MRGDLEEMVQPGTAVHLTPRPRSGRIRSIDGVSSETLLGVFCVASACRYSYYPCTAVQHLLLAACCWRWYQVNAKTLYAYSLWGPVATATIGTVPIELSRRFLTRGSILASFQLHELRAVITSKFDTLACIILVYDGYRI